MSRPRDWYSIPGMPSDVVRDYKSLPSGRLLVTTLTQNEIATLEGDYFRTFQYIDVPSSGSAYIYFRTPPAGSLFAFLDRAVTPSMADFEYNLWGDVDITGATIGAPWRIFNENGYSDKVSGSIAATITGLSTTPNAVDHIWIDSAYTPDGGVNKLAGSPDKQDGFKIVIPDTVVIVELKNYTNTTNRTLVAYEWAEVPQELA